jgi:hypothetical protein
MPDIPWDPTLKQLFWTNSLFGNQLYAMLEALVRMGALEMNADRQFRWHKSFDYVLTSEIETDD